MSSATTYLIGLLPLLAGCIWISKEDYVEAMGCDPDATVTASDLRILDEISTSNLDAAAGVSLRGWDAKTLGRNVATVGDLDGDRAASWVVGGQSILLLGQGAPPVGDYEVETSEEVYWHEVSNLPESAGTLYVGAAAAGDLSGDGARDLLVYTTVADPTDATGLAVYLLDSEETSWSEPSLPANAILEGDTDDVNHAFEMLRLVAFSELDEGGNQAGDGFTGLLMAASEAGSCLGDARGAVYYFEGRQLLGETLESDAWSATADQSSYEDGTATSQLGCAIVASAGDMDGDGRTDALLGAPGYDDVGRALLVPGANLAEQGALTLSDLDVVWQDRDGAASLVGYAVSGAGDVDGDGYDDVLVGTHEQDAAGEARLYRGGAPRPDDPWVTFTPEDGIFDFGREVAGGGDLDSDGQCTPDLVISGTSEDGQARWVFLGAELEGVSVATTAAAQAVLEHGVAWPNEGPLTLAQLADIDGDGLADILSGAPAADGEAGEVWLLFGGAASP